MKHVHSALENHWKHIHIQLALGKEMWVMLTDFSVYYAVHKSAIKAHSADDEVGHILYTTPRIHLCFVFVAFYSL